MAMQDAISEALVESVFDSIVTAAEQKGVESHELFALLQERFHQTKQPEMPRKKRLKTKHGADLQETKWWYMFPSELTHSVLDLLPRRALADFSQCSKQVNQVVSDYAKAHLQKTNLGKSLIKRHMEGTSEERGKFSPAFLLLCIDAAPEIGSYFEQKDGLEIKNDFNAMMYNMYPNDIYDENFDISPGRVMFLIDGIVVYQALEGDVWGDRRFRVCRCPLPALLWSMTHESVEAWISKGEINLHEELEGLWLQGWSLYDWQILEQHNVHIEDSDEDSDEDDDDD